MIRSYLLPFSFVFAGALLFLAELTVNPGPAGPQPDLQLAPAVPICGSPHTGGVPESLLNQTVSLRAGSGAYPTPTSTKSTKAQAFFEQGMAQLHSYQLVEAARSFHQALRHDSLMAMSYVGLSRTYLQMELPPYSQARAMAEKAARLEAKVSEREKAHIRLRLAQLKAVEAGNDPKALTEYRASLRKAVEQFPGDAELWLLAGNAYEESALGRGQGSSLAGIAIYEKVLQMAPSHPAPHHYLIHAYEGMRDYQKALQHGQAYASLAPGLPHALHMYAHDLMKTGQMDKAIEEMKKAGALERNLYAADGYKADYDWHHGHNITLLALCYRYQGRLKEAEALARESYGMGFPSDSNFLFYRKKSLPELLLIQNRQPEVVALARSLTRATTPAERLMGHYFLGLVQLQEGNHAAAQTSLQRCQEQLAQIKPGYLTARLLSFVKPYPAFLEALVQLKDPTRPESGKQNIRAFQRLAREQFGPDGWIEALFQLETLASLSPGADQPELARESVSVLADHDPTYPGTYYLQGRLARAQGNGQEAARQQQKAMQGWSKADKAFTDRLTTLLTNRN